VIPMSEIITMSSKGQIVVPKGLREQLSLITGTSFVIFGKGDTLVLRKVDVPTAEQAFAKVHAWGKSIAGKKGWKENEVMGIIHKGRGVKSE
jgi:AbrB family looped-hinge helix DNA binding protein